MTVLLVAVGAAVGAPLRYLTDRVIQAHHDSVFPWGTFTVNIVGSLLIGVLAGLPTHTQVIAAVGVGFCGGLTTYSTFGYETVRLSRDGSHLLALLNVVVSVLAGLGAGVLGYAVAHAAVS